MSEVDLQKLMEFLDERVPDAQRQFVVDTAVWLLNDRFPVDPPPRKCSKCGRTENEVEYLIDITVTTADGEEGFAQVTQLLCENDYEHVLDTVIALGFVDHHHGGINFLEDLKCCGGKNAYENCPTPSEYGNYTVGQDA